jgi:glycosyltransferase involved in cell wall biosynthesis
LRALHVGRALEQVGRVEVVVLDTEGRTDTPRRSKDHDLEVVYRVGLQPCPSKTVIQKANWAVNPRVSCPHGVGVSQHDLERVIRTAEPFDLIWFFELRTANSFPRWAWPRSVVDVSDLPSTYERSVLNAQQTTRQRLATAVRLWSWKRRERLLAERFNVIAVCSDADKQYLRDLGVAAPVHVIPNAYEPPVVAPVRKLATPPRIGFIGVFDHEPNVAGIRWFAQHCWPRIKRDVPAVRLRLVGRLNDGPLKPEGVDIDALGWLPDPTDEIATWSAMIVPVHVGAGTRGKIAHAFSQKCPVVSTSLGAYGYDPRDGEDMFLAESAETFAEACVLAISQPATAAAMAERAWARFLDKWTWDAVRPQVWSAAEDALRLNSFTPSAIVP